MSPEHPKMEAMKTKILFLLPMIFLLGSCSVEIENNSMEKWKKEIVETEKNFAKMAGEEGISRAFLAYAAEDAVVMRSNALLIGKDKLSEYFDSQASKLKDENLSWEPDFVDVSASGDLAYTYGQFIYSYTDSTGTTAESRGIFHTVWKRQADGSWRFVWD